MGEERKIKMVLTVVKVCWCVEKRRKKGVKEWRGCICRDKVRGKGGAGKLTRVIESGIHAQ